MEFFQHLLSRGAPAVDDVFPEQIDRDVHAQCAAAVPRAARGVIATIACGLYISWNGPLLISSATRLQGIFFWDLFIYLIEGSVFLFTGLQARTLIEKAHDFPVGELLLVTAMTG